MAYYDTARLKTDTEFLERSAACYATEQDPAAGGVYLVDPDLWATRNAWAMASQPGFGDAYASALVAGNEHPGSDPAVITDAQVLSAVQSLIVAEAAAPVPATEGGGA